MVNFPIPNISDQPNNAPPASNLSGGPNPVEGVRSSSAPQVERTPASAPQTGQTGERNQSLNQSNQNFGLSQTNGVDQVEISRQAVGTAQRTSPPSPESSPRSSSLDVNSEMQTIPSAAQTPQGPQRSFNAPALESNPSQPRVSPSGVSNPEQVGANPPENPNDVPEHHQQLSTSPINDLMPGQFINLTA